MYNKINDNNNNNNCITNIKNTTIKFMKMFKFKLVKMKMLQVAVHYYIHISIL